MMTRTALFLMVVLVGIAGTSDAGVITYVANLDGASESPPNASPATGFAEVMFDQAAHSMRVQITFSGLEGTTTASHIHSATSTPGSGTAMVATQVPRFDGFPVGVTSGTYDRTFDTSLDSFYNPAFEAAHGGTAASAEAALAAGLAAGEAYLNIHTTVHPGGEIRGFLHPIPEPSGFILMGAGSLILVACGWVRRLSLA
jgi:hypothetical protein